MNKQANVPNYGDGISLGVKNNTENVPSYENGVSLGVSYQSINQKAYNTAFTRDDPLAAFDPQKQAQLKQMLDLYDDPEKEAKKQLLSHFLSTRCGMTPEQVYDNFDHAARVYNGGKPTGVDALWNQTRQLFTPRESEQQSEVDIMMGGGDNKFSKISGVTPEKNYKEAESKEKPDILSSGLESYWYQHSAAMKNLVVQAMDMKKELEKKRHTPAMAQRWGDTNSPVLQTSFAAKYWPQKRPEINWIKNYFVDESETLSKAAQQINTQQTGGRSIIDTFKDKGAAAGAEHFAFSMIQNSPQIFIQTVLTLGIHPSAGAAYMAANSAGTQYGEIRNDKTMDFGDKLANVTATAASEFAFENIIGGKLIKNAFAGASKKEIARGFTSAFNKIFNSPVIKKIGVIGSSALQNGAEELATKAAQTYFDIATGRNGADIDQMTAQEMLVNMFSNTSDDFIVGGGFGAVFGASAAIRQRSYAEMDLIKKEAADMTQARKQELLDKNKLSDNEFNELEAIEASENDTLPAPVLDMMMDAAGLDTETKEAVKARRRLNAELNPVIDPAESAARIEQAVQEIGFNGQFKIVETQNELPEHVQAASLEHSAERVEGVIDDDNNIYFVAGNIAPHRAAKVALHEIVGHAGLHQAFGEKVAPLLKQVWDTRAADIREMMADYGYSFDFSIDEGKINAAEEFIAKTAESGIKPKWWQEVIAQARKFLRKVMPNLRFSDNDINSLLAKAGKHASGEFSTSGNVRFAAALRQKGDPNTAGKPGQIRTTDVKYNQAFLNNYGIGTKEGLYLDCELCYGRHSNDFKNQLDTKEKIEAVLSNPEFATDEGIHICFLGTVNGKHYKVKIWKKFSGKYNHIRSIHERTQKQYEKDKKRELPQPVPSKDGGLTSDSSPDKSGAEQKTKEAPFNNNINSDNKNVKFSLSNKNLSDYALAVVPQIRRGEIATADDIREVYPQLSPAQAVKALDEARQIIAKNNRKYGKKQKNSAKRREINEKYAADKRRLKLDIINGTKAAKVEQLRKYPEMLDFYEELLTGQVEFGGNDVVISRIAALSDKSSLTEEMIERYRILRHVLYLKEARAQNSGASLHDSKLARDYIVEYARKFMPKEEQHRIVKYLRKDNITPAELQKALAEIEQHEMQGSKMKALKKELNSAITELGKISRRTLRDHYDRLEVADNLREIARKLPDDARKGEVNKVINLLAKAATASTETHGYRRVELTNPDGSPMLDENGAVQYKRKVDENGKPRFAKDGKPLYEWEPHPSPASELDRLIDRAFDVVNQAVTRSEKAKNLDDIKKLFDFVKVGKTPKGIPQGKLTPEIQKTVDGWRGISQLEPSQIADRKEYLFNAVQENPDNSGATEELAALDLFGDLKHKSLEQSHDALMTLEHLIDTGRTIFKDQIAEDIQRRGIDRARWIEASTGGEWLKTDAEAKRMDEKRRKSVLEMLKTFHRGNLSFEWLLNNLSRKDKSAESLGSPLARELSREVHQSTQTETTAVRNKHQQLTAELEKIFDASGRALDRKLNDFKAVQEQTGVFRYAKSQNPVTSMYVSEAEDVIKALPETDPERAKLVDAVRRAKMDNKRKVKLTDAAELGKAEEVPMSKDEALNFWLMWQQEDKRPNMRTHHWADESINQLEKFLGTEGLKLGRHLQKLYADEYYSINDVFKRVYHVNMPQIKNYAPAMFDTGGSGKEMMIDAAEGMSSLTPGALISRRAHNEKPKQVGASDVYLMHTYQMEHWKAWADTVHRLRGIFCGKEVRTAVQQHYGKKAYSQLLEKINHFADGGNRKATSYAAIDAVRKGFTYSKLAFNVGVFVKQLTSLPAYAMDIPMSSYLKYSTDFWSNPVENAKFLIESSDYIKNRWGEGYERDVMRLLHDTAKKKNVLNRTIEAGMVFGKVGDVIPVLIGGHAVYKHHYTKLVRDGVDPAQAHKQAMIEFEMSTDRTQQAGNMKDLGLYQSGGSIARLFTMFTTSIRQYYQHVSETFADALAGKNRAKSAAAKKAFIAFVVLPILFRAATDVMNKGDNEEEYDSGDYLRAMIVGPLNGTFIVGNFIDEMSEAIFSGQTYGSNDSAIAFSDKQLLTRSLARIGKIARGKDYTTDDLMKVIDEAARGSAAVFAPSALYSIFRREAKRVKNIFNPEPKHKRRYK